MNYKRILTCILLILLCSALFAQQQFSSFGKPGIGLINIKTNRTQVIYLGAKVKCKTYRSDKTKKGRILGLKDSIIIVKDKEIQLRDIRNIRVRTGQAVPIKTIGVILSPVTYGLSLFLFNRVFDPGNYNMARRWRFTAPVKTGIDTSALNGRKRRNARDSVFQNTSSTLFLTINPLNNLFNQHSIEVGYQPNRKYYVGVEGGIIKANCWWNQHHVLYDGTDDQYPYGFYDGWLLSVHLKQLNITKNHWFFEIAPFYKYLTYDHVHFYNSWGDPHPNIQWIRSEQTNVFGIKIMMGKRIFLSDHFLLESVFGVNVRGIFRSYTTFWTTPYPYIVDSRCNILIHQNMVLPGIQAGLLLSFGNYKIRL